MWFTAARRPGEGGCGSLQLGEGGCVSLQLGEGVCGSLQLVVLVREGVAHCS